MDSLMIYLLKRYSYENALKIYKQRRDRWQPAPVSIKKLEK